jgi:hypothetical protein
LDGVEEDKTERKISAIIRDEDILISVQWPLTLQRAEATTLIGAKNFTILIPLGNILWVAEDVAEIEMAGSFSGSDEDNYFLNNDERTKNMGIRIPYNQDSRKLISLQSVAYRDGEEDYYFYYIVDEN